MTLSCPYEGCGATMWVSVYDDGGEVTCDKCKRVFDFEVEVVAVPRALNEAGKVNSDWQADYDQADRNLDAAARGVRLARGKVKRNAAYEHLAQCARLFRFAAARLDAIEDVSDEVAA